MSACTDTLTRRSIRHPSREYGVLLSWAPMDETTGEREVLGPFPNILAATLQGGRIAQAGGAEYLVVHREDGQSPWLSPSGYTITETVIRHWGTP